MMKRLIRQIIAGAFYYTGLLWLISAVRRKVYPNSDLVILMYHRVLDDPYSPKEYTQPGIALSSRTFDAQMAFLSRRYKVLPLSRVVDLIRSGQPLPKKCAAITFDDGWRDNFTNAYPVLKKYDLSATIFLTTDFIGTNNKFWFHHVGFLLNEGGLSERDLVEVYEVACRQFDNRPRSASERTQLEEVATDPDSWLNHLKTLDDRGITAAISEMIRRTGLTDDKWPATIWTLRWDDIAAMDPKIIEYGSHGCSHRILNPLPPAEIRRELVQSKGILEDRLKRPIKSFAYPNGDYTEEVKQLVREAGYQCAITTKGLPPSDSQYDLLALQRLGLHEGATAGATGKFSRSVFACLLERIL